ncbi:Fur-regulated basic protein FbpA [Cytobacillus sp. IB215665]|uniref:Fur-regulated basic protein FbpA n=1 Tax=Cytobacillus sp. IB215665 TaxID=3097357 RepID=UPI002A1703D5|nr:Fur-regulated basic protein FbpA [Cytobacillus sp. IB215665]MDX8366382.1 Fur-regulated basic protein FbpA [Cytobacillus sp. IB215665]
MKKLRALTLAGAITLSGLTTNNVLANSEEQTDTSKVIYSETTSKETKHEDDKKQSNANMSAVNIDANNIPLETMKKIMNTVDEENESSIHETIQDLGISILIDNGVFKSPDDRHLYELNQSELFTLLESVYLQKEVSI